jgi:Lar family restriction alleviation protein
MFLPIRPCPFCTNRDVEVDTLGDESRQFYAVSCDDCKATGPLSNSYEGAVEAWNMRDKKPGGDGQ